VTVTSVIEGRPEQLLWAGGGGLGATVFLTFVAMASGGPLGVGDVKCGGLMLGAVLGWAGGGAALLVGAIGTFGGAAAFALLLRRAGGTDQPLPLGPFLFAGSLVGVLLCGPCT
jgi:prepilin signal peptidase PulO-like enzyme (type II secretory pathway)